MLHNLRERARSEGGFTLIELLVVMIIIAILMAVAVPTFLAQKNNAQKTKATANIKQIVNAIEACAVNNTSGGYEGCTATSGSNSLTTFEKGLASLTFGTAGVETYQITPTGGTSPQGYTVTTAIKDGDKTVYFAEVHGEDGTLTKLCGASASSLGTLVSGSRTCTNGKWG